MTTTIAMTSLQQVPLHDFHLEHGGRMVSFAGFEMPVQYKSILEEHRCVREKAGLFDVSHMGEALVKGPQAEAFLNYMLTGDIPTLELGQALYSLLCYPDGGVVDDLIVYKKAHDTFLLCLNASNVQKDIDWLNEYVVKFDCSLEDLSKDYGQLALQGPAAVKVYEEATGLPADAIKRFTAQDITIDQVSVYASRTGYTGEDGLEFYIQADKTQWLAELLLEKGKAHGLELIGLGARDSLRLEAGYPLYGHEISKDINPLEAGLGWVVKLKKDADFIGKQALLEQKENGITRKVVFFKLNDKRIAREGASVLDGDKSVGRVLSGAMSPVLNQPIGSALIEKASLLSETLYVDIRGKSFPLNIVKPPLHKTE